MKLFLPLLITLSYLSSAIANPTSEHSGSHENSAEPDDGPSELQVSFADSKYEVVGCLPVTTHVENDTTVDLNNITHELCVTYCNRYGFNFTAIAAVPLHNVECACLSNFASSGSLTDCNMQCPKSNEVCGGSVKPALRKIFYTILKNSLQSITPVTTPATDSRLPASLDEPPDTSSAHNSNPTKRDNYTIKLDCKPGYTEAQNKCVDIDECMLSQQTKQLCAPNALCINLEGTFGCICKSGYNGDAFNECDDTEPDPTKLASHIEITARLNGVFTDVLSRTDTAAYQSLNKECKKFVDALAHKVDSASDYGGTTDCMFINGSIIAYAALTYQQPIDVQDISESVKHFLGRGELQKMGEYMVVNFYAQEYITPAPAAFEVANLVSVSQLTATVVMAVVACFTLILILALYAGSKVYQRRTHAQSAVVRELKVLTHVETGPSTSAQATAAAATHSPSTSTSGRLLRQTSIKDMLSRLSPSRQTSAQDDKVRFIPGKRGQKYSHVDSDEDDDDDQALEIQTHGLVVDGPGLAAKDDDELLP